MILKNPENYEFITIRKSLNPEKKYDAILKNKQTDNDVRISFGSSRYGQFKDSTPLKLYKHLDNNDPERKRLFKIRHAKNINKNNKYSSIYFSDKYLWS